jgi:cell division protein FtsB
MTRHDHTQRMNRDTLAQGAAIVCLLILAGLSLAGPSGIFAWGDNASMLAQRNARIATLESDRDILKNRVALLDPRHADPDLVGELLRKNLNVAHPDEVVITLD